jgi:chemotaxis protein MotA
MLEKTVMLQGILAVQAGENPRIVQWKLVGYLSPAQRAKLEAEQGKNKAGAE